MKIIPSLKKRAKVIAVISLLAFTVSFAACGPFKAPTDAAKAFMAELRTDPGAAYDHASDGFRTSGTKDEFLSFLEVYPEMTQVADSSFNNWSIENDVAVLRGTLTFDDGTTSPIEFTLQKINGTWLVSKFDLSPAPLEDEE
ncbi:hypothetical protein KKC94_03880 [Patescibacteria group bacterium]|nr:hypothetical protein [Patescibacteria group bacterium]